MFDTHRGLDRGHNEAETDDMSDRIAGIQDRYVRSAGFQDFLQDMIEEAEEHLGNIEGEVRRATGEDGIDVEPLDAMLRAARAMYIRRHVPSIDEVAAALYDTLAEELKNETATTG